MFKKLSLVWALCLATALPALADSQADKQAQADEGRSFNHKQVMAKAEGFFGDVTEGLATAIERVFEEQGEPNAIITGEEVSGAIGVGLRYGRGQLQVAGGEQRKIYWQGPSVGFDVGGNASKVFTLVYNLNDVEKLYQRFPGVEGSFYFVAGVGVNYQQSGELILAPIRTGVGMRTAANIGYLHYTKKKSWIPF